MNHSIFKPPPIPIDPVPSSSPAFGTPLHTIRPYLPNQPKPQTILPVSLPAAVLRPVAFRTFTKKHGLTLNSSALQILATFVGRYCGSEWREKGLAEVVLEEVARTWKRINGGVIVDGDAKELKDVLKNMEASMHGGRFVPTRELSRQDSTASRDLSEGLFNARLQKSISIHREDSQTSMGMSALDVEDEEIEEGADPRQWLKVIDAFTQPRMVYNVGKKHFDRDTSKPSLFPPPAHKTKVFRQRYDLIHQRLLRNESFQTSTTERGPVPSLNRSASTFVTTQNAYKLTEIANLLGRNNTPHLLLGLLTISPTGTLAISDLTGSISLDLSHAKMVPEDGAWFVPGMIVLVDGIYEEDESVSGFALGGGGGVGGTIGGKFVGLTVGEPPCERRQVTLGLHSSNTKGETTAGGGFGWVDFIGVGSERAVGPKLRAIERKSIGRGAPHANRAKMVILGEVNLDIPACLQALKRVLTLYAAEPEDSTPMTFVLMGNFVHYAVMARGGSGGSIEYKEYFDALAALLSDYPTLLQSSTFIFVPGDNDGWASAFSSGAATPIPRKSVPDMFTSRVKRAFATANTEAEKDSGGVKGTGEAIWTTNPSRLSLFGPAHEIVLFRDDMSARLRRSAVRFEKHSDTNQEEDVEDLDMMDTTVSAAESHEPTLATANDTSLPDAIHQARKLVKTILDQSNLSPFRLSTRPVLWDYANSLHLYPLPTALVLADKDMSAFVVTYEGCLVMNPGMLVAPGRRGLARWIEYDIGHASAKVRESGY